MANLGHNLTDKNNDNKFNHNRINSHLIPHYLKVNNDNVHKNHTHLTKNHSHNNPATTDSKIFHQNIRGISHKIDEILISLAHNSPHVLCLTEHHLQTEEITNLKLGQYSLGAYFCRQSYKQGGVSICLQWHSV